MGYPYPQDTIYPNPSRNPPFPSAHQADKYEARKSKTSDQQNNYSNVIKHHPLQDQQCLVSGNLI